MISMSIVMNAQKVETVARGYLGTWLEIALLRKPRAAAPVQAYLISALAPGYEPPPLTAPCGLYEYQRAELQARPREDATVFLLLHLIELGVHGGPE